MTLAQDIDSPTFAWTSGSILEVPSTDIVSFAFAKATSYDDDKALYIDAKDPAQNLSARSARDIVCKLVRGWTVAGLSNGDCVTLVSANHIIYPLIWLGVLGAGGVVAGANPALTVSEFQHHLAVTATKFVVVQESCAKNVLAAAKALKIAEGSIFVFRDDIVGHDQCSTEESISSKHDKTKANSLDALLNHGQQAWHDHANDSQPALHATTSGTTGLPKAAVLPHRYLVSQALMLEEIYRDKADKVRQLICLPVFHTFASNLALVLPLRLGITTYFMPRFYPDDFLEAVAKFSITDAPVVPPIISTLTQIGDGGVVAMESLRRIICAGSRMSPEVQCSFLQYIHKNCRVLQVWGTTETGWLTLTPDTELNRIGSVGRLAANTKLKLVAGDGTAITEEGVEGEALVKSSSMMLCYRDNPFANETAFDPAGYYRTGDRVSYRDGRVFVEGRIKDVMKVKGWQVSPEELEEKLLTHPKVLDCAVVRITTRDSAGLEQTRPRAYVVGSQGVDADDLSVFMRERVVSYKQFTGGIIFVDSIPRNPSGKILRRTLLDRDTTQS